MKHLIVVIAALFAAELAFAQTESPKPAPAATTAPAPTDAATASKDAAAAKDAAVKDAAAKMAAAKRDAIAAKAAKNADKRAAKSGAPTKHAEATRKGGDDASATAGSLMTVDERRAHWKKVGEMKTADECKAYMAAHRAQLQARAKEQHKTLATASTDPCERFQPPAKDAAKGATN